MIHFRFEISVREFVGVILGRCQDAAPHVASRFSVACYAGYRGGELQDFRPRRDIENDAAPFAVEGRQNGIYVDVRITAPKMHREAAERAVGMRRVGVHKPEP
jgi:hypothetical protein